VVVNQILNTIVPGRTAREARKIERGKLDKELKESFPTSDPPASIQPGSGLTGAKVKPSIHRRPRSRRMATTS
jgi:hypothetical protein